MNIARNYFQNGTTVCIYPTPLLRAGCDIKSIFKWSKAGLNFPFPRQVDVPRLKNLVDLTIYPFPVEEGMNSCLSQEY